MPKRFYDLRQIRPPPPLTRPTANPLRRESPVEVITQNPNELRQIRIDQKQRAPLRLASGMVRPGTPYTAKGFWYDGNLIRWYEGVLQAIGGWSNLGQAATNPTRGSHAWVKNDEFIALFAAHDAIYSYSVAGGLVNITPMAPEALTVGEISSIVGRAYGSGDYGSGPYGAGDPLAGGQFEATTWQIDNYGDQALLVSTQDKRIWHLTDPAVAPEVLLNSPRCLGVVVTPERFVVALSAAFGTDPDIDRRHVRWAHLRDITDWESTRENLAGDYDIATAGRILAGKRTQTETLIWTETDLYAMRWTGGTALYRFFNLGECSVASRRCMQVIDSRAYWMGRRNFYVYTGVLGKLPCTVADFIFNDINKAQVAKIWCDTRAQYSEVTWYYPSLISMECDSYVTFNYKENAWYFGRLDRCDGISRVFEFPIMVDNAGNLYEHEVNDSEYGGQVPFAETGVIELGDGTDKMFLDRIYPDGQTQGRVQYRIFAANEALEAEVEYGPFDSTTIAKPRITARQIRLRVSQLQSNWRFGTPRVRLQRAGSRDS